MANIKVQQKLAKQDWNDLYQQIRAGEVRIIKNTAPGDDLDTDDVIGKVHNAFNLGRKIEVVVAMGPTDVKAESLSFVKRGPVYYLMAKE